MSDLMQDLASVVSVSDTVAAAAVPAAAPVEEVAQEVAVVAPEEAEAAEFLAAVAEGPIVEKDPAPKKSRKDSKKQGKADKFSNVEKDPSADKPKSAYQLKQEEKKAAAELAAKNKAAVDAAFAAKKAETVPQEEIEGTGMDINYDAGDSGPTSYVDADRPTLPSHEPVFSLPVNLVAGLEEMIMGVDVKADMEEMLRLRDLAYELLNKSKQFDLKNRGRTAHNQAWGIRNTQIKEIGRLIFNDMQRNVNSLPLTPAQREVRWNITKSVWNELQDAYYKQGDKTPKGAQFLKVCEDAMLAAAEAGSSRMLELYTADCKRADEILADYQLVVLEQQDTWEKSQEAFAAANALALKHGWETTKAKANEGGDAAKNGK